MPKRIAVAVAVFATWVAAVGTQSARVPVVEVHKDPSCGCCAVWVEHLKSNGFTVRVTESASVTELKDKHGVPARARSCHTALVGGYVVEGHVPAADVHRLLREKPKVAGIAVPGMPSGSPGMEVKGMKAQPYQVLAFDRGGATRVFASH